MRTLSGGSWSHLKMFLVFTTGVGQHCWHLKGRGQGTLLNILQRTGPCPPQTAPMSTVPRLRNSKDMEETSIPHLHHQARACSNLWHQRTSSLPQPHLSAPHLIYPPLCRWTFSCFHVLIIEYSAAMNTGVHVSF